MNSKKRIKSVEDLATAICRCLNGAFSFTSEEQMAVASQVDNNRSKIEVIIDGEIYSFIIKKVNSP